MPSMRQSAFMRHTLLELLYQHDQARLNVDYPAVLVLLTHHFIGLEEGLASLRIVRNELGRVSIFADEHFRTYSNPLTYNHQREIREEIGLDDWLLQEAEVERKKACYQTIFIPVLSFSLMFAMLHYDDRHPFVRLILWALFSGIPVGALTCGINPVHASWKQHGLQHGNHFLKTDLRHKVQQLRHLGIQTVELEHLHDWLTRPPKNQAKRMITNQTILDLVQQGANQLPVTKGTIITPLARDSAREFGLSIIELD